jgi:hypothetical protein
MKIGDLYKLRKEQDTIIVVPKEQIKIIPEKKWKFRLKFKK